MTRGGGGGGGRMNEDIEEGLRKILDTRKRDSENLHMIARRAVKISSFEFQDLYSPPCHIK